MVLVLKKREGGPKCFGSFGSGTLKTGPLGVNISIARDGEKHDGLYISPEATSRLPPNLKKEIFYPFPRSANFINNAPFYFYFCS